MVSDADRVVSEEGRIVSDADRVVSEAVRVVSDAGGGETVKDGDGLGCFGATGCFGSTGFTSSGLGNKDLVIFAAAGRTLASVGSGRVKVEVIDIEATEATAGRAGSVALVEREPNAAKAGVAFVNALDVAEAAALKDPEPLLPPPVS